MGPKKDTKNDDEKAKMLPKLGPKNCQKNNLKKDPNIISLSFGSLRLSRAEAGRAGENAGEVIVEGVVCHMWPRTK